VQFESLILCQNKTPPKWVAFLFWQEIRIGIRTDLNAARMSVAGEGLTEPNID